jgi:hypothetical protein
VYLSVTYVFLHLIPELSEGQETLMQESSTPFRFFEYHI